MEFMTIPAVEPCRKADYSIPLVWGIGFFVELSFSLFI